MPNVPNIPAPAAAALTIATITVSRLPDGRCEALIHDPEGTPVGRVAGYGVAAILRNATPAVTELAAQWLANLGSEG